MKKVFSIALSAIIIFCSFSFMATANAQTLPDYSMSWEEWNSYCDEFEGDNTVLSLTPGSNESELNFSWHSDILSKKAVVRISKNQDMSNYSEFKGSFFLSDLSKQKVNRVTVNGLEPNTVYYYVYGTDGKFSTPVMYRTLSSDSFKFLYISDIQCNSFGGDTAPARKMSYSWQNTLANALTKNDDISFVFSAGDQTQNGNNKDEWCYTLAPKALRSIPLATTVGNHDKKGTNYKSYVNNPNTYLGTTPSFTGNDYWFRYGDVLFMVFNSTNPNLFDHFNFVKNAISQNADAKWRVGSLHHDIYGTGHHAADNDNFLLQCIFAPIADKFDFDIVLTGHEHLYGRSYYMYNNEVVNTANYESGRVTDPEGTIYFTASGASNNNRFPDEPYRYDWLGKSVLSETSIYSTLEFTSDTLSINSYDSESEKLVDEFNVRKTESGFSDTSTISFGDYFSDAFKRICGDYYVIFDVISKILGSIVEIFN